MSKCSIEIRINEDANYMTSLVWDELGTFATECPYPEMYSIANALTEGYAPAVLLPQFFENKSVANCYFGYQTSRETDFAIFDKF
jgi:hypothetical protein